MPWVYVPEPGEDPWWCDVEGRSLPRERCRRDIPEAGTDRPYVGHERCKYTGESAAQPPTHVSVIRCVTCRRVIHHRVVNVASHSRFTATIEEWLNAAPTWVDENGYAQCFPIGEPELRSLTHHPAPPGERVVYATAEEAAGKGVQQVRDYDLEGWKGEG